MNKGTKVFSLVMSMMLTTSILASCQANDFSYPNADWKDGIIGTVGGKDYTYNDIYGLLEGEKDSAKALYDTAKNVLAQLVTPVTDSIRSVVDSQMKDLDEQWNESAKTNNTTYKEEMEKTLKEEHVDSLDELKAKKIAAEQSRINSNNFYSQTDGANSNRYYISEEDTKKYSKDMAPYHVSHILLKLDASSADTGKGIWDGQISTDDAKQIGNAVSMLASNSTFGSTAQIVGDDDTNKSYGELSNSSGVAMQKNTSYINEFKLGIYAYDTFINPETKDNADIKKSLRVPGSVEGVDSSVEDALNKTNYGNGKVYGIPLSACFEMSFVSEKEKADSGKDVQYSSETQYPRNVLFNNYFNNHAVSFIYDDSTDYEASFVARVNQILPSSHQVASFEAFKALDASAAGITEDYKQERIEEYEYIQSQFKKISASKFANVDGVSNNLVSYASDKTVAGKKAETAIGTKNILVDEKGNPIIVVRGGTSGDSGYQGLHFIVVNHDPFTNPETDHEYWRVNIPDKDKKEDAFTPDYSKKPGFVNFVKADPNSTKTYQDRVDWIETSIKSSDPNYEFQLWEHNLETFKSMPQYDGHSFEDVMGEEISGIIDQYISYTRLSSDRTTIDMLDDAWKNYANQLNLYTDQAEERVIPTVCISAFENGSFNGELEDLCNVKKK